MSLKNNIYNSTISLDLSNNFIEGNVNLLNLNFKQDFDLNSTYLNTLSGLNIFTGLNFSNLTIRNDIFIDKVSIVTNIIAERLSPFLVKNFTMISITDTKLNGSIFIRDSFVNLTLNNRMLNIGSSLITNLVISNVYVGKDIKIDSNNQFSQSILIENSIVQGDIIIENDVFYTGSIVIRNSTVKGQIRIEKVSVGSKIKIENDVKASSPIVACPNPYYRIYKDYKFVGCYFYVDIADTYDEAARICNNINSKLLTIKSSELLNDLPTIYSAFTNFYFWVKIKRSQKFNFFF